MKCEEQEGWRTCIHIAQAGGGLQHRRALSISSGIGKVFQQPLRKWGKMGKRSMVCSEYSGVLRDI
jgi:hypothetical protein